MVSSGKAKLYNTFGEATLTSEEGSPTDKRCLFPIDGLEVKAVRGFLARFRRA